MPSSRSVGPCSLVLVALALACGTARRRDTTDEPGKGAADRWWTATAPCPAGAQLVGAPPPAGDRVWCEKDGLQEGRATSFYPDGVRKSDGTYRAGELDGSWRQWFHDGKPRTEGTFARGRETGTWKVWFASGGVASERVHVDAHTVRIAEFRPGGAKLRTGTLVDGQKDGRWIEFTEKGEALEQVWEKGRRISGVDWVVGVTECDDYVQKYTRCIELQSDPTQREQMREGLRWTVQSWRDALATGGKPNDIAAQCKATVDATKPATASLGCKW